MKLIPGEWRYFDEEFNIPYPWYTKPCLKWLQTLDLKDKRVFEFGVGESTDWYRSKGAITSGVDSNEKYVHKYCAWYGDTEDWYLNSIYYLVKEYKALFDIVVIDGDYRDKCTEKALKNINPGGYIITDNYKQPSVQEHWPLTEKLIEGMDVKYFKEPGHQDWQTIVVTK